MSPYGFLMFSGSRKRVHWEQIGQKILGRGNLLASQSREKGHPQ